MFMDSSRRRSPSTTNLPTASRSFSSSLSSRSLTFLSVATPVLTPYIVPATIVILVGLFLIQSHGTARIGKMFGPVMLLWFTVLAVLGIALGLLGFGLAGSAVRQGESGRGARALGTAFIGGLMVISACGALAAAIVLGILASGSG